MDFMYSSLMGLLFYIGLPVVIILIVTSRNKHKQANSISANGHSSVYHDPLKVFLTYCLIVTAGLVGIMAVMSLPTKLLGLESNAAHFACRVAVAVFLVLIGLVFKGLVRNFLMIIGIVVLVLSLPYVFTELGSIGPLIIVALAMAGLVAGAIFYSKHEKKHG